LLASCQEGLCLILSLLFTAISDSFRDMQEQLNNSLLINTDRKGPFSTWVSFAEIYNENAYDLLEPIGSGRQKRQNLALGVDNKGQVYVKGRTFVIQMLERFVAYCLHGVVTSNIFFCSCLCVNIYVISPNRIVHLLFITGCSFMNL
jgi:hypothetical protein